MSDTIIGNYIKNVLLDTGSYIKVSVNVVVPGSYTISTNTVNGYSFSTTGTFTATGSQTVHLAPAGAPLNPGIDMFTITAGASSCVFSVTVLAVVTTANNDLFPLTMNSYWIYDDLYYQGSTVRQITAQKPQTLIIIISFSLLLTMLAKRGTYPLTSYDGVSGNALTFIKDLGSTSQVIYWTIDPSITDKGSVTITALNNHYIEGMFTAFCKNDNNTGEVAHISNGSFKGNF